MVVCSFFVCYGSFFVLVLVCFLFVIVWFFVPFVFVMVLSLFWFWCVFSFVCVAFLFVNVWLFVPFSFVMVLSLFWFWCVFSFVCVAFLFVAYANPAAIQSLLAYVDRLEAQRDRLLIALSALHDTACKCDGWESFPSTALDAASAAITEAESQT